MGKHQLYKNLTGLVEVHAEVLQLLSANGDPGDVLLGCYIFVEP